MSFPARQPFGHWSTATVDTGEPSLRGSLERDRTRLPPALIEASRLCGHTASMTAHDEVPPRGSAPSVVVVDDDTKLVRILTRALERAGYDCTVAASGDQALWAVAANEPDALVLDVMIPHPGGVEVCRHLRHNGFTGGIVVISARGNPQDRAAARRAGADAFLAKPFSLADLARVVGTLTAARRA